MFESLEDRQMFSVAPAAPTPDQPAQSNTESTIVADCRKAGSTPTTPPYRITTTTIEFK